MTEIEYPLIKDCKVVVLIIEVDGCKPDTEYDVVSIDMEKEQVVIRDEEGKEHTIPFYDVEPNKVYYEHKWNDVMDEIRTRCKVRDDMIDHMNEEIHRLERLADVFKAKYFGDI